jgi:hypothetical protein
MIGRPIGHGATPRDLQVVCRRAVLRLRALNAQDLRPYLRARGRIQARTVS